jgi:DNA modification methylase
MSIYYEDDLVTLYHGDCLEELAWLEADVLVTDPPYGIAYRQGRTSGKTAEDRRLNQAKLRESGTLRIRNDGGTAARDSALALWGAGRPGLVFGSWRKPRPENTTQRLVWIKDDSPFATGLTQMPWVSGDEEIYVIGSSLAQFTGKPRKGYYITHESRSAEVSKIGHPTPKPIGLMELLIAKCPPGVIADPFAGSGSTLIASRNLGRRAVGIEMDERYCELIAKRLSQQAFDFEGMSA